MKEKIILEENELYLLEQCSKRYSFYKEKPRKEDVDDVNYSILFNGLQYISNKFIETGELVSSVEAFNYAIDLLSDKYDSVEIGEFKLNKLREFDEAVKGLNFEVSVPLQSKLSRKVDCSNKVEIRSRLSLLTRTVKAQIVRGIVISPYNNIQDIQWSMIHRLQYEVLKDLHKKYSEEGERHRNPLLTILYYNKGWKIYLMNKSAVSDQWRAKLSLLATMVIKDFSYPIVPCKLDCPYKKECQP